MTLDRAALIKRLRTLLGDLSMRVAGRNKDDVTESLSIVRFCVSLQVYLNGVEEM